MDKSIRWARVILVVGVFVCATRLSATQYGTVVGTVYDSAGNAVSGATVHLIDPLTGFSRAQSTDSQGGYTFSSVPATDPSEGEYYLLSVEKSGFKRAEQKVVVQVAEEHWVQPPITLAAIQPPAPAVSPTPKPEVAVTPSVPKKTEEAKVTPPPPPAEKPGAPKKGTETAKVTPPPPPGPAPMPPEKLRVPTVAVTQAKAAPSVPLDLANPTMGGVIDGRFTRTLPLANRDFFELALLVPGTYPTEQGSPLEGASLVVNGVRANMNNFLLDGVDNNDYTINQALPFQIVDAMQEFRVQTSASSAEYGRSGGAQVNTISRAGLNTFHGSLFEFNRNSALSSNYPLSAYNGGTFNGYALGERVNQIFNGSNTYVPTLAITDPVLSSIFNGGRDPHFNQNQFGGNVGGRLVKDKAFFFANWESLRANDPRPVFERVPDSTCRSFNACNNAYVALGGNSQTATQSTALADQLFGLYPQPNVPTSTVVNAFGIPVSDPQYGDLLIGTGAFYVGQSQNFTHSDNFLGRIDLRASERFSMSFKHNVQDINQTQGGSLPQGSGYPGNGIGVNGRNQNFSYNLVGAISDRTVNEFRLGWNRFRLTTLPLDHTLDPSAVFHNVPSGLGLPSVLIGGYAYVAAPDANLGAGFTAPSNRADNVTSVADNLSMTRGRHILKFGAEFRQDRLNVNNEEAGRGLISFNDPLDAALISDPAFASIARVSGAFGGGFDRSFHANAFDWFIQDTWRPRSNLTLTFGVRHEINQAPVEARNRLVNNYPYSCNDPNTGQPALVCLVQAGGGFRPIFDSDGTVRGTTPFAEPNAGFNTDWKNFAPHFGLAWDPRNHGKTVFRAGYALMYDQMSLQPSVNMLLNPPFVQQTVTLGPALSDTFPAGFPLTNNCGPGQILGCWGGLGNGSGAFNLSGEGFNGGLGSYWFAQPYSITSRDPNTRTPYVHQFYAGIEQRLGNKAVFEVAYVGTLGRRLLRDRLLLECTPEVLNSDPAACFPRSFVNLYGPGFGTESDAVINQETSGSANYHSLQARLDTRAFHGLSVHLHYQWAHSIDNASSSNPPVFLLSPPAADIMTFFYGRDPSQLTGLNNANPTLSLRPGFPTINTLPALPSDTENSANLEGQRASSDFDIRHRLVAYYTYELPKVSALRGLGNGWQVAGITTFQTGQPFSVYGDFFGVPLRPSLAGSPIINNSNPNGAIDNALPAGCGVTILCPGASGSSAFDTSSTFLFESGSLPRNSFIGPRSVNFNFSVLKNVYLRSGEGRYLQFRGEFFNLLNRANYRQPFSQEGQFVANPCPKICSGSSFTVANPFFGQILQAGDPREIQLALKFIF